MRSLALTLILLAACGSGKRPAVGPDAFPAPGTHVLRLIDGEALPVRTYDGGVVLTQDVTAGSVTLRADWTYAREHTLVETSNGQTQTRVVRSSGAVTEDGGFYRLSGTGGEVLLVQILPDTAGMVAGTRHWLYVK